MTKLNDCRTCGIAIDARSPLPLKLDVDEPLTVGADRIVNVLAAVDLFHSDSVVVDFGTATTFDCVTADARFLGGAIMPGLRTSADQLTRRAASALGVGTEADIRDYFGSIDHEKLTYRYAGRDFRLTDVYGRVVREIIA